MYWCFKWCVLQRGDYTEPTFQNYYSQVTPANSENITAFVIDNPHQLYVGMIDTAIPIANMGKTFGFATTTGSTTSGQSTNKMLLAGGHATKILGEL